MISSYQPYVKLQYNINILYVYNEDTTYICVYTEQLSDIYIYWSHDDFYYNYTITWKWYTGKYNKYILL